MVAVIFTRGERWDPGRVLEEQEGLEGHVAFIRRHRELGLVIEGAPFHDPATRVEDDLSGWRCWRWHRSTMRAG